MKDLSRDDMKKILGGTCVNVSCGQASPPSGTCTVASGANMCCWEYC